MSNAPFVASATDWRHQIQKNQRRTFMVIAIFIVIYLAIGLLIDMYLYSEKYVLLHESYYYSAPVRVPLMPIFFALISFQVVPYATLITGAIAIFCLFITYTFSDKLMLLGTEYHQITPETATTNIEKQLYNVVEEMKIASGLHFMPRVYIIDADYMNAFASGYSEKSAMVAITRGLIEKLNRSELQAVMAHELSHVRHLDIKLTMTAAILSNIILIAIDLLFRGMIYGRGRRGDDRLQIVIVILRFVLPLITILLLLYLSRTREYMADAGCVELMRDNKPLADALMKIDQDHQANSDTYRQAYRNTPHENVRKQAYIYDPTVMGIRSIDSLTDLFSTHPNTKARLAAIGVSMPE